MPAWRLMVQPKAADTAALFTDPLVLLKFWSLVIAYQTRPFQPAGSAMLRPN